MAKMTVNFNNVRKQAIYAYEDLVEKLNASILKSDQWAKPNCVRHNQDININGHCLIDVEDIQKSIDNLRSSIGTIAMTYIEGDEKFKDVYEEVFPVDGSMLHFNDTE